MTILNLGAGEKRYDGALNVDIMEAPHIDIVADLSVYPWPWTDNSVDGIHASHLLEHFPIDGQEKFIRECHRILKPGGFLRLVVPHCTNMSSLGCFGHWKCFSHDTFQRYLDVQGSIDAYMFKGIRFKTVDQRVNWVWEETVKQNNLNVDDWMRVLVRPLDTVISWLINLGPRWFERFWYPIVGGASEVVWKGIKV